jgi:ATP-dependent RNA helicase DDX55/SPB4
MRREYTLKNNEIGAVIITPTRELAQQINSVLEIFVKDHPKRKQLSHALFIGGTTTLAEDVGIFKTKHPRILIGTPGRLEEMLTKTAKLINTKELEMLVLDEADRLLDMGFSQQLSSIIANLPKQRRTGLFSATMTDAITELVRAGLRNPVRVVVKVEDLHHQGKEQRTPASLKINYLVCDPDQKMSQIARLLLKELDDVSGAKKFIIYFATCASVDYFYKIMSKFTDLKPFSIHSLHGQMDTKRRTATYSSFVSLPASTPALLLCTDVASRGLDIPDVDYVIQFDPPQDPKAFSHRCGRTARAGRNGKATVFLNRGREEVYVEFLKLRKIPMESAPYLMEDLSEYHHKIPQNDDENQITPEIPDPSIPKFIREMRQIVKTDRDLHDKSFKAFTSFIRAYSKHDASYIFRVKDLDLGKAATGYGLLKVGIAILPVICEIQF